MADSNEELTDQLRQLAQNAVPRRAFDAQNLDMTLEIGERFRLHAVADEIMIAPRVSIRYHNLTRVGLGDLVDLGVLPAEVAELLYRCVLARLCIAFAGEQNAGKTTDLRAAVDAIRPRRSSAPSRPTWSCSPTACLAGTRSRSSTHARGWATRSAAAEVVTCPCR